MRKLVLKMSLSLDGFVAGPKGEIDWMFKEPDPVATSWVVEKISAAGAHLMGRKTFHDMAAYWPASSEPFAAPMNEIPKVVFSRKGFDPADSGKKTNAFQDATRAGGANKVGSLPASAKSWAEARVMAGDMARGLTELKKETGKFLLAHGGAEFGRSLVETGLVEEYWLVVYPVILGNGLPLFSNTKNSIRLRLESSEKFPSGVLANIYRRADQ